MSIFYSRAHWYRTLWGIALLVLGLAICSQAQVYYLTSDNTASTSTAADALNRLDLSNGSAAPVLASITTSPLLLAIDRAGSRAFIYEGLTANRTIKVFTNINGTPAQANYTLAVPAQVSAIEYDPTGDYVYFLTTDANASSQSSGDGLYRIKADGTASAAEPLLTSFTSSPLYLTLNIAGNRAYVYEGLTASRGIKTIDLVSKTVIGATISVPALVTAIDYSPTNGYLYYLTSDGVGNTGTSTATDAIYRTLPDVNGANTTSDIVISNVSNSPIYMTLDLASERIYVADNFNTSRGFRVVQTTSGTNGTVATTYAQSTLFTAVEIGQALPATTVASITRNNASPTNAGSVQFTVTFASSVAGVTTSNFATSPGSGITGSSVASVSGSGTTYTVTVNTGSGSGTLGLRLANDNGLTPGIANKPFTGTSLYTIDKTAPAAPLVIVPANGSTVSTTTPTAGGTAEASSTVTVIIDGSSIGTTTANSAGNWALTQPTALAQGSHTVRARATDAGGNTSVDSNTNTFTVDSVRPSVSISSTAGTSGSTTGSSPVLFTITFSEAVTGFVQGDLSVTGGTVSGFTGSGSTYTFNVTPSGSGNTVTVNVAANTAQDAAGNGNTAASPFSLTFQAPTITLGPTSLPGGQQGTTYSQTLSSTGGTAPYAYAITAGALPSGLSLNLSNGTISGTPTANGTFTFTVTATDASAAPGPYSGARSYTLTINPQPVTAAPVVTTPANNSFSNNRSVTVAGMAPAGSTVSIYIGNNLAGTPPASAAGTFSYVIPGNAPDGTYTTSATAQSSGATVSPRSNSNTFTIDGTAPTVALSTATVAGGGTTSTAPVSFTATFSESVTGFTAAGISVAGGSVSSGPTAGSSNTYSFQVTPNGSGAVSVQVLANAAQDQAGNNNTISSTYSFNFQAPTITLAPASLPNGTQGTAYSVAFTATGGSDTYTYAITAGALPAGMSLSGNTLSGTPAASGSFTFTLTATDNSMSPGPYSGSRGYTLTINPQPVTAAPVVTTPANGALLNTATPTYTGTAPANGTVTVYVDDTSIGATTADGAGNWSLTQPTALPQGNHKVRATAQRSGQAVSSTSNQNSFTVDTAAPTVVITSSAGASGSTTGTTPIPFSVTFSEPVTGFVAADLTVSGGSIANFAGSGTSYTVELTPAADGLITVEVPANVGQDGANNGNTASSVFSITYSRPVTATPVVQTPANGSVTTATKPTYTGTATPSASLTLLVDENTATSQTTTVDGSGNWALTQLSDLAPGAHTVQARAQLAGQTVSAYSAVNSFTVVGLPSVVTATPTGVTSNGATLGGAVTDAGAGTVSERGVVYVAGNGTPTTSDTKLIIGAGTGSFSQAVTNLTASTTYSVRAYASNQAGTSYGATQLVSTGNALAITSVSPSSVCAGGTINVAYTNSSPGTTLTVYLNGPSTSNLLLTTLNASQASGTITATIPADRVGGAYSVYLSGGSTSSGSANVTVNAIPSAPTTTPVTVCQNATPVSLATVVTAAQGASLNWYSAAAAGTGSRTAPTPPTSTVGSTTYYVSQTINGCESGRASLIYTVNPLPGVTLTNDGPLTCAKTTVTLTAAGNGSYQFSAGATPIGNTNQASVSSSGIYSVTVTAANGCSATAQTSVEVNTSVAAPTLTASALSTENAPISVTASGCSGTINWTATGGTGTANGAVYTFTQPGNYVLTATCTVGTCTSPAAPSLTLQIRPGGFAISGVELVRCQLVDAGRGQYEVSLTPQYSGLSGSPVSFGITNELAVTTAPGPYTIRLYTDNPAITLTASQADQQASYRYSWLAACNNSQPAPNRAPVAQSIPDQVLVVGQPYQLELTNYFTDPDGQVLSFTARNLPAGLSLSGSRISGSPTQAGTVTVAVTALDPGGLQAEGSVVLRVDAAPVTPTPGVFSIAGVTGVRCETVTASERRLIFSPVYTGLTGESISFGITNEVAPTSAPGPYSVRLYTDNPAITLTATQGGSAASYRYNWLAACTTPANGRQAVAEANSPLTVVVLGNPIVGESVEVLIGGVDGQAVELSLSDLAGNRLYQQSIQQAANSERVTLPVSTRQAITILKVNTATQQQTLKLIRP